jgi:uncharacterized protein
MKIGKMRFASAVLRGILGLGLASASVGAQTKPAESTSKVKRVMLYNKVGGWVHTEGLLNVKTVMTRLAAAKHFELVQLYDDVVITLDYLKQFDVIVWNNNTNGQASVPSATARQAVLDYLAQGGGWMLIHGAGDHDDTWPELAATLGTDMTLHGKSGAGEVVVDSAARRHRELKWMVDGLPAAIPLTDTWDSYRNTVRPLAGVTVVATSRGDESVVVPFSDGKQDQTYIWAREIGKGRMIFNAIGYGEGDLFAQGDSIVPKLYWENLRYAAGDYRNGCMNPESPAFDPAARVSDPSLCAATGAKTPAAARNGFSLAYGARKIRLGFDRTGEVRMALRDLRGAVVWRGVLGASVDEAAIPGRIPSGMYQIEARSGKATARYRLVF